MNKEQERGREELLQRRETCEERTEYERGKRCQVEMKEKLEEDNNRKKLG